MSFKTRDYSGYKNDKWLESFTRFGIISKGIVYCLVGLLTILAAMGLTASKGDKAEAVKVIYAQPFGKFILIIVAIGLSGYVTWRLFQAFGDTENHGKDIKGIFIRIGYATSALIYLALGVYVVKLIVNGQGGDDNSRQFFVSKILAYPGGQWIIGITACIIIGSGIRQIYKAVSGKFMKNVHLPAPEHDTLRNAGIIGYISRGIVWGIVGYFLLRASLRANPSEAQGTEGVFNFLQHTFGEVLMCFVAIGLIGYGVFMFVKARYQRMRLPT